MDMWVNAEKATKLPKVRVDKIVESVDKPGISGWELYEYG